MPKHLIVAGFHRSGTSLVMQYLHRCGLFAGYDLIGGNDSNKYGHFEDREIVRTHDWILAANQASWMVAEPFAPVLEPEHWTRLGDIIAQRDAEYPVWGFKDPRVCNFLVQWKCLLPDAKVLMVFRNPCESIHSLHRRHAHELLKKKGNPEVHRRFFKEPDLALRMWNVHNAALIAFARAHPGDVLVVHHGTFKQEFPLAAKLNELWDLGLGSVAVSAVYDESLTRLSPVRARTTSAELVDEALDIWRTLAALEQETTGLADLKTENALVRNDFVFDLSAAIMQSEKELLERENESLKTANAKLQGELGSLSARANKAAELDFRLKRITKSRVWKITKPAWKAERWLSEVTTPEQRSRRKESKSRVMKSTARPPRPAIGLSARQVPYHYPLPAVVLAKEFRNPAIVIVVPVYNAPADLRACLDSVVAHTSLPASLLIIDDASTNPAIPPLLDDFSRVEGITVVRNEENLGFTRTVNKGIDLAGRADVVLLNSDAIVTPRWLENLHLAAYSHERIATVTPLSDNAGAFSVPEYGQPNPRPSWAQQDAYARMITQTAAMLRPTVPTGNGFCMYVRRSSIDEVGMLDEAAFPRGYGEENDFCMRAVHRGWRNIVDDRTIVYHRRSASFGDDKSALLKQAAFILNDRYPEYKMLIKVFEGEQFESIRERVRSLNFRSTSRPEVGLPRALFVISITTGGTALTNADLMKGIRDRFQPWLLRCDTRNLELSYLGSGGLTPVASHTLAEPISIATHVSDEYDRVVEQWLVRYTIELVHIRHISKNSLNLVQSCRSLGIPVVFSFHDFYCVCPTVKLLDENLKFCGGVCTETAGECHAELWPQDSVPPLKNRWIRNWRSMMARMLWQCDAFVTTSISARQIITSTFPELDVESFRVIPHGRSFSRMHQYAHRLEDGKPVRILLLGSINEAKGGEIIIELAKRDEHRRFEFHILGNVSVRLMELGRGSVVLHGAYEREEVASKIRTIRPHLGAIFSIWAETYCHSLTELWACGLPVLAFDIGAIGERIRAAGGGWLLPHDDLDALFTALCEIADDPRGMDARLAEVRAWQCGEGQRNTVAHMATSYLSLYEQVLEARRTFFEASNDRVSTSGSPPPALAKAGVH
jgi:GT2 family glycosyltransferase/glycosyltransferase involved in cell wall biosynthesis